MIRALILSFLTAFGPARAGVEVDIHAFGESLGGWDQRHVDYSLSGAKYRTYRPELSPSPDGGIYVSIRIDHRRGWLSSDDHAVLEVSFGPDGSVTSAKSTLAIQGRTVASDLIRSTANVGGKLVGAEGAVQIGSNLVADLSAKMMREKLVEAGRVSFPSAVRHNFNRLYQAIRVVDPPRRAEEGSAEVPAAEPVEEPAAEPVSPDRPLPPLEIRPYGSGNPG